MDKTTITKEQLNLFVFASKQYLSNTEESDLSKAIEAILPSAIEKLKKVDRKRDLFKISLAKKTNSKHIDLDKNGRYQHTEEDTKKIWAKMDEIDKEEVMISCHVIEKYPTDGITFDMKRAFQSVVIPAMPVVEIEQEEEEEEEEQND
jgi:primosomal protein N'